MADVTGGTPPTNASPFAVPADIKAVYDHFGGQTKYSVANAAALPGSGNWLGRLLMAEDTDALYQCTALPGSWTIITPEAWQTPTLASGITNTPGFAPVRYRRNQGVVEFEGTIDGSAGSGFTLFTFASGYRPVADVRAWASPGSYIEIATTGVVTSTLTGAKSNVAFSGHFRI